MVFRRHLYKTMVLRNAPVSVPCNGVAITSPPPQGEAVTRPHRSSRCGGLETRPERVVVCVGGTYQRRGSSGWTGSGLGVRGAATGTAGAAEGTMGATVGTTDAEAGTGAGRICGAREDEMSVVKGMYADLSRTRR